VEPTELFGAVSAFNQGCRNEYAAAAEKAVVLILPRSAVLATIGRYPLLATKLTTLFAQRLQRVESRLKSLLFRSSRQRLIHLLNEFAETYGQPSSEGIVIAQKISHQDMASIIGATRETVTITLGELQSEGMLKINKRRITIRNAAFFSC